MKDYRRRDLVADTIAGLTVGLVALPLAMAFGIASGVTPQAGIYTAIRGGFLVSASTVHCGMCGSRAAVSSTPAAVKPGGVGQRRSGVSCSSRDSFSGLAVTRR